MNSTTALLAGLITTFLASTPIYATASRADEIRSAVSIPENYPYPWVHPNITYTTANGFEAKLDVHKPAGDKPKPTLMYFHGGGWMGGYNKEHRGALGFIPFLQLGWTVVSVEYRTSDVSLAPAAVEDCLCALRWMARNAAAYNIDPQRIVLMGHSAGGHLALTTGMIPLASTGIGAPCSIEDMYGPGANPNLKVAAIINWFGITDVPDLLSGPHQQGYAVRWIGNQPDGISVARKVSPLSYIRKDLPPIITIHGDQDPIVPFSHATRLHAALAQAGVSNQLITIPGGVHGVFGVDKTTDAYLQIFSFLERAGLPVVAQ